MPDFSEVHKFCEDTLGRPIWTHDFADIIVQNEIREKLRPQIIELIQHPAALRGPTREMVERMRGEWIMKRRHHGGFRRVTGVDDMGERHTITIDERCEYDDRYCPMQGQSWTRTYMLECIGEKCAAYQGGVCAKFDTNLILTGKEAEDGEWIPVGLGARTKRAERR